MGGLVKELHDLLGELVVSLGPDSASLVCFDHLIVFVCLYKNKNLL